MKRIISLTIIFLSCYYIQKSFCMVRRVESTGRKIELDEVSKCLIGSIVEISWITKECNQFRCTPGPITSKEHAKSLKQSFELFIKARGDDYIIMVYDTPKTQSRSTSK